MDLSFDYNFIFRQNYWHLVEDRKPAVIKQEVKQEMKEEVEEEMEQFAREFHQLSPSHRYAYLILNRK